MSTLTLIGIDPGIRDTALTSVRLDYKARSIEVSTTVWSNVTDRDKFKIKIDKDFLQELHETVQGLRARGGLVRVGVEAFRSRGYDKRQDETMQVLVQTIEEVLGSTVIVDNTSMKKIVKEGMLQLFHCKRFPGTNHADSKSAARVALRLGIMDERLNMLLSDYVVDHLDGEPWSQIVSV